MTFFQGIFLGLTQGITEFLPISSSGHLVLAQYYLKVQQPPLLLDSFLHFGTLLAVLVYFRQELSQIFRAVGLWLRRREQQEDVYLKLFWYILIGSIPAAILGLAFEDFFNRAFSSPPLAAVMLFITGVILWFATEKNESRELKKLTATDSIFVGVAQSLAIMPGISRSGVTITAGLFRGLQRSSAARFSFLLSLPAVLGANSLSYFRALSQPLLQWDIILFSVVVAFLSGYLSLAFLMNFLKKRQLRLFSIYCFIVSGLALAFYYWR